MAFRHWQGSVKPVSAAWVCPSCQTENTGPLEAGCAHCKAGADAKARAANLLGAPPDAAKIQFDAFMTTTYPLGTSTEVFVVAERAFMAGVTWATHREAPAGNGDPVVPGMATVQHPASLTSTGGQLLAMVHPQSHEPSLLDTATQATIVAALAFYRDNQLAYGGLPGQLSAAQVTELIEQLSPAEPPDDQS